MSENREEKPKRADFISKYLITRAYFISEEDEILREQLINLGIQKEEEDTLEIDSITINLDFVAAVNPGHKKGTCSVLMSNGEKHLVIASKEKLDEILLLREKYLEEN